MSWDKLESACEKLGIPKNSFQQNCYTNLYWQLSFLNKCYVNLNPFLKHEKQLLFDHDEHKKNTLGTWVESPTLNLPYN